MRDEELDEGLEVVALEPDRLLCMRRKIVSGQLRKGGTIDNLAMWNV